MKCLTFTVKQKINLNRITMTLWACDWAVPCGLCPGLTLIGLG